MYIYIYLFNISCVKGLPSQVLLELPRPLILRHSLCSLEIEVLLPPCSELEVVLPGQRGLGFRVSGLGFRVVFVYPPSTPSTHGDNFSDRFPSDNRDRSIHDAYSAKTSYVLRRASKRKERLDNVRAHRATLNL